MIHNWRQKILAGITSFKLWQNHNDTSANQENQITINFGAGTLTNGFPSVTIQLFDLDRSLLAQKEVSLSEAPNIDSLLQKWRTLYLSINGAYNLRHGIELNPFIPTNVSVVDLDELGAQLKASLERWLFPLERELLYLFQEIKKSRIILVTDEEALQRIPWHLWRLFDSQHCTEYALSAANYEHQHKSPTPKGKVRILAVFGDSENLNLNHERQILESLPNSDTHILEHPERSKLDQALRNSLGWDILFFAGHSNTQNNLGILRINDSDVLTTNQLTSCLTAATRNGTQLAIFNSCDGIGLAHALEGVGFSHVIVMGEPIPDPVAQDFITLWLLEFSQGKSFYSTTRKAREQLKILENDYPCASWLPVIFQNPTAEAPTWQKLKAFSGFSWRNCLIASLLVTTLVLGVRATGLLRNIEFALYDTLLSWRKDEATDPRILVVTGRDEARFGYPFEDEVIAETIEIINQYQPRVIGLDLLRDLSQKDPQNQLKQVFSHLKIVSGACIIGETKQSENSLSSPLNSNKKMGFVNVFYDYDAVLRRVSLFQTPNSNDLCRADKYLGSKLALEYLATDSIIPQITSEKIVQIQQQKYHPLPAYTGTYQQKGYWGYEILINYRMGKTPFQTVSIADVLDGKINPDWIRDRIVIIGMDIPNSDRHQIPFQDDVPGVMIVAHVSSQILANAIDKRPLISILPLGVEISLILASAVIGGLLAEANNSYGDGKILWIVFGLGLIILPGLCWFIFSVYGGWISLVPLELGFLGSYRAGLFYGNQNKDN